MKTNHQNYSKPLCDPNKLIELLWSNTIDDPQILEQIVKQLEQFGEPLSETAVSDFLQQAIEHNSLTRVRFWKNKTQNPMLYGLLCLRENKFDLFDILLENQTNKNHILDALLASVSLNNNLPAVNFLIERGADPSYRNHLAVRNAIEEGTECVLRLLDFFDHQYGSVILAAAIRHQRYGIVQHLLELGVDPLDNEDHAFDEALKIGDQTIVAQLLKYVEQLPPSVVFTALHFKVESQIMMMLFQHANMEDVRNYIYKYASENISERFEHMLAVHQKQILEQHTSNSRLASVRKI